VANIVMIVVLSIACSLVLRLLLKEDKKAWK
jgi:hypothetical protein